MKKTVLLFAAMLLAWSVAASREGEEEEGNGRVQKRGLLDKVKEGWEVVTDAGRGAKAVGKKLVEGLKKVFKGGDDEDEDKKAEKKKDDKKAEMKKVEDKKPEKKKGTCGK